MKEYRKEYILKEDDGRKRVSCAQPHHYEAVRSGVARCAPKLFAPDKKFTRLTASSSAA